MAFVACHFLSTDEVVVLSQKWLLSGENACLWPPITCKEELKKAVLLHKTPLQSWSKYNIVVIGRYDNYLTAKKAVDLALDTSNLDIETSDKEKKKSRKKRQRKHHNSRYQTNDIDDEEDDEDARLIKKSAAILENPPLVPMFTEINMNERNTSISQNVSTDITVSFSEENPSTSALEPQMSPFPKEEDENRDSVEIEEKLMEISEPLETSQDIIKLLQDIRSVQREHTIMLRKLLPLEHSAHLEVSSSMPKFPLDSQKELEEFEKFLDAPTNFSNTVKYFGLKTSADYNQSVRKLMPEILTNSLAEEYNWAGRPPKKAFKFLKMLSLIICVVKENHFNKDVPTENIQNVIKDWLKHANFRKTYKEKKQNL